MNLLTCTNTGQAVALVKQIAKSGEGEVWQTDLKGSLAKVYYSPGPERIRKLEVMLVHPPQDPNSPIGHHSFAWPTSLLKDEQGNAVGFLMPAIANSVEILDVYNPQRRQKVLPGFNWLYLHVTAMNIASIMQAIHEKGYVLGDIKPQNILVNNRALPSVIDTDSFQVRHPNTGELYRCPVGSEGFTPVELLGQDLAAIEQTEIHDRFRLAVIIYLLLFGDQPFKGKWIGEGDSPEPNELLRRGFWPHAPKSLIQPGPLTIPLDVVHPEIQRCFLQCFNDGHTNPSARPTAQEWVRVLKSAIPELEICKKNDRHYYSQTYGKCYWCERKSNLGVDIFPAAANTPNFPQQLLQKLGLQKVAVLLESLGKEISNQVPDSFRQQEVWQRLEAIQPIDINKLLEQSTLPDLTSQINWKKAGIGTGIVGSVIVVLLVSGQLETNWADTRATIAGLVFFFSLVFLGFLWIKFVEKSNF